jgi:hypothetical protein
MLRKIRLSLGVVTVAAVGAALVPAVSASATAVGPSIAVTPASNLHAGDVLAVTGSGMADGGVAATTVYMVECHQSNPLNLTAANCDAPGTAGLQTSQTDGAGNFTANYIAHTGTVGDGTCPTTDGGGDACYLLATTNPADAAAAAVFPISFDPAVYVSKATGLVNGQLITVSGAGYLPSGVTVYMTQCSAIDEGQAGCDLGTIKTTTTDANGAWSIPNVPVKTGTVGDHKCSPGGTCYIVATTDLSGADLHQAGAAPIAFKPYTNLTTVVTVGAPTSVKPGRTFLVKGQTKVGTKAVNGLIVTLYQRAKGTTAWTKVATVKTRTIGTLRGAYHFSRTMPRHAEQYQVRHPKQIISLNVYKAAISKTRTVARA